MNQQIRSIQYSEKISVFEEREKLLNHLRETKRKSAELSILVSELKRLLEEVEFTRADTLSLTAQLNQVASEFGVPPISMGGEL